MRTWQFIHLKWFCTKIALLEHAINMVVRSYILYFKILIIHSVATSWGYPLFILKLAIFAILLTAIEISFLNIIPHKNFVAIAKCLKLKLRINRRDLFNCLAAITRCIRAVKRHLNLSHQFLLLISLSCKTFVAWSVRQSKLLDTTCAQDFLVLTFNLRDYNKQQHINVTIVNMCWGFVL